MNTFLTFLITTQLFLPTTHHFKEKQVDAMWLRQRVEMMLILADIPLNERFVDLIIGTAAVESDMGNNLGDGKYDIGIYQINRLTHKDIHKRILPRYPTIKSFIDKYVKKHGIKQSNYIIEYQILLAMVYYIDRTHGKCLTISEGCGIDDLSLVWKSIYNTNLGRGTRKDFMDKYKKYIGEVDDGF